MSCSFFPAVFSAVRQTNLVFCMVIFCGIIMVILWLYLSDELNRNVCRSRIIAVGLLHGRVVKGVGHLGNGEAMEAGGREFDRRPGHYIRMSF